MPYEWMLACGKRMSNGKVGLGTSGLLVLWAVLLFSPCVENMGALN